MPLQAALGQQRRPSHINFATHELLRDYAAGDAVPGVAGGIRLVVVGFGVDDYRRTAVAEQRVGAVAQCYIVVQHLYSIDSALSIDREIAHITSVVAFGIIESVLLTFRIEMWTGGFEVWAIALRVLMKVDSVLARWEIMKFKLEADTRPLLKQAYGANALSLGVLKFNNAGSLGFGCAGKGKNHQSGDRG